jgi:NAD(P)-dependent dehydrogenase (short-subunit alcohol dehydrogenase family)
MGGLSGRVAIVTGSSRGVGRGEALALAKEGAAVALVATTMAGVEKVANEIEEIGGTALPVECDVSVRTQVDAAVAATLDRFGRIDILVNNAQRIPVDHPFEAWTEAELRETWESGFLGTWNFMQACFDPMKERGYGRIINTCSMVGYLNWPGFSAYAATKEGVRALTRTVSQEWGQYGITVNVISPAVASDALDMLYPEGEIRDALLARFPMRRFGDPEADIGRTVAYLAGPDASYVTGCTLNVDGGMGVVV